MTRVMQGADDAVLARKAGVISDYRWDLLISTASEMERARELLKSVALSPQACFPLIQESHIMRLICKKTGHRVGKPTGYRFVTMEFSEGE